jgi:hypothetical protein
LATKEQSKASFVGPSFSVLFIYLFIFETMSWGEGKREATSVSSI